MTTYRPGDHLRTPVDIAADAEVFPYECPDCGEGHDGMTTGTERCPDCEADNQCEGHESLAGAHMGESVYCNGSCRRT